MQLFHLVLIYIRKVDTVSSSQKSSNYTDTESIYLLDKLAFETNEHARTLRKGM